MDNPTLFNIFSLVLAAISFAAIVMSIFALKQSTNTASKVSSKEHEITENLKYDILQLIAVLNAIDEKAGLKTLRGKIDYSHEIEILLRLQSHPEFILLIRSIQEKPYRYILEYYMHQLTDGSLDDDTKRENVYSILTIIKKQVNIDGLVKQIEDSFSNNWNQTVKELCNLSSHSDSYGYYIVDSFINYDFFKYLIKEKNIHDDVVEAIVKRSRFVDSTIKKELIFRKYYTEFCDYYDRLYNSFVIYLVETKKIEDIEIAEIYSVIKRYGKCHYSFSRSNNVQEYDLTYLWSFVKYQDEYEDFRKHQLKKKDSVMSDEEQH